MWRVSNNQWVSDMMKALIIDTNNKHLIHMAEIV